MLLQYLYFFLNWFIHFLRRVNICSHFPKNSDGNFAVAWSGTLNFTVEKSSKTLIGSGLSGEGLVNVYRGTGKVLLAPVNGQAMDQTHGSKAPDNGGSAVANAALNGIMGMLK